MAKSIDARLTRLEVRAEARRIRQMYAVIAAEWGMDPDELQRDCEAFLAMSLAQQLAEVDRVAALGSDPCDPEPPPDFDAIKRTLTEAYHR